MKAKNIGVILAGGAGERFDSRVPKQFMKVAGKMVIEHTVDVFERSSVIDEIAIVVNEEYISKAEDMLFSNNWRKVKKILSGGKKRYQSTLSAMYAYDNNSNINLILHDAVRPLLSQRILYDIHKALETYDAVDVAIPASDTIIKTTEDMQTISSVPNRNFIYQGQTPQAFKLKTIKKAYELALNDPNFRTTDDCGVVVRYLPDTPVFIVEGERRNIKLTHVEDIYLIDKLFQLNTTSVDEVTDFTQLKEKVLVVFGGSSGIGKEVCTIAEKYGAYVYSFSRTCTNTDISNFADVRDAFEKVAIKERRIDYVVLTAAILKHEVFHTMQLADIDLLADINYKGMIYVSKCAYPYLKESNGQLLHFTSSSYTFGRPCYSLYSSAKAAVVNFVQALSQEWSASKVRVNCINPERTITNMRLTNFGIEDESTLLKPEVVAKYTIATLLSDNSGQVIDVRNNE